MPAHTSPVPALVLWTVWKFSREFCTRQNFPSSFRADLTTHACCGCIEINLELEFDERSACANTTRTSFSVLFCGSWWTLRPDGRDRESDQDSKGDFEKTMKR